MSVSGQSALPLLELVYKFREREQKELQEQPEPLLQETA